MPQTIELDEGEVRLPMLVENSDGYIIRGFGQGRTRLIMDAAFAIELRGKIGRIEISDLTIDLQGKGCGIGNPSGAEVDFFRATRVEVMNGYTGISCNADLGGRFRNAKITDCHVHDMPGELSGQGYGIHAANAERLTIEGNLVERCGRHGIYQARSRRAPDGQPVPAQVKILNNTILEHRAQVGNNGAIRAALVVSRSAGVLVEGNQIHAGFGGAMEISYDAHPCRGILVRGNQMTGRRDQVPYVVIGEQQVPQTPGVVEDVTLDGNSFDTLHDGEPQNPDIMLWNGRNIVIKNGIHRHRGVDNTTQRAITLGHSGYAKQKAHLDGVFASGNEFIFDQDSTGSRDYSIDGPLTLESATKRIEGGRLWFEG